MDNLYGIILPIIIIYMLVDKFLSYNFTSFTIVEVLKNLNILFMNFNFTVVLITKESILPLLY